ncbi:MAG TPA: LLM class flavin-dependent oxidoreductase [Candidatus Limnocylindria bacterium]|jgi:alkanesulfonate monooxygenase SsuD/methylene tetrahydromethanopterin reductase-like flavin-dependent oxidoreductase (luciferase family)
MSDGREVHYGLDVATTGEWADPNVLVELAVSAEAAGWNGFFVWDILLPAGDETTPVADPWIALAAIAARTQQIRIGALVTPLPRRQPWTVAKQVATLDVLSGGRVIFGAGIGWKAEEFTRFGRSAEPASRAEQLEEGLAILDAAWRGERLAFHGRHYTAEEVILQPVPIQRPGPPVWLAAGWPHRRPLRRAARGDGVYLMTDNQATYQRLTPADVAEAVAALRALRPDLSAFDVAVNTDTAGLSPPDAAASVQALAEAGATWLVEVTPDTLDEHRALIRRGPVRADERPPSAQSV